jgi:hypothetical protein
MDRETMFTLIRGTVVASYLENSTKTELCAFIDTLEPPCDECGATMVPELMKCPECGPKP